MFGIKRELAFALNSKNRDEGEAFGRLCTRLRGFTIYQEARLNRKIPNKALHWIGGKLTPPSEL
jgi:hypothetical protein